MDLSRSFVIVRFLVAVNEILNEHQLGWRCTLEESETGTLTRLIIANDVVLKKHLGGRLDSDSAATVTIIRVDIFSDVVFDRISNHLNISTARNRETCALVATPKPI